MNILVWFVIALLAALAFWNVWLAVALAAGLLVLLAVWGLWGLVCVPPDDKKRAEILPDKETAVIARHISGTGVPPVCHSRLNGRDARSTIVADVAHPTGGVADVAHATTAPAACPLAIKPAPRKKAGYNKSKKRKHR